MTALYFVTFYIGIVLLALGICLFIEGKKQKMVKTTFGPGCKHLKAYTYRGKL